MNLELQVSIKLLGVGRVNEELPMNELYAELVWLLQALGYLVMVLKINVDVHRGTVEPRELVVIDHDQRVSLIVKGRVDGNVYYVLDVELDHILDELLLFLRKSASLLAPNCICICVHVTCSID